MNPRELIRTLCGAAVILIAVAAWIRLGPIAPEVLDQRRFISSTIVDRNGVVLYEPLSASGGRGIALTSTSLPLRVVDATLAAEDRRFFRHPGVDPIAVARAAWHNVKNAGLVEGGSTLSQQTAKLLLGSRDRGVATKVRETLLALRIEHRFSKREILAMYLNLAPYGNRIHGISRASRVYFGCAPEDLTHAQAAFLASLPQRPGAFNPLRDATRAVPRQRYVLSRMKMPANERAQALRERLELSGGGEPLVAQHFVERVLERSNTPVIRTTLDVGLQREVLGIIAAQRQRLIAHGATSVAVAVLDNRTGDWLAWEGSGDYFGDGFGGAIDAVVTPRQPGSTLKPFTYALAFERGYSPATVLPDVVSNFPTAEEGVVYSPRNYDGRYRGPLRVRSALAGSQNVPAVAMLAQLGTPSLHRLLRNAGFTNLTKTADYYGLGLTLGDAEVRLDQLIAAYAAFARGGRPITPRFRFDDPRPSTLDPRPLFSKTTSFWIADILSDRAAREYAFGSGGSLDFPFRVAVKTGTSQAYRDNWTIGFTRDVTVGVWVGNFDREELRNSTGVTGAAPIFNAVMLAAVKRVRGSLPIGDEEPIVAPPDDLEEVAICALSGLRPSTFCESTEREWARKDAPAEFCSWHHDEYVDWPPEYRAWARAALPPAPQPRRPPAQRMAALRVVNPPDGATYLIDPTLRSGFQTLKFRATASARWEINGRAVPSSWPLQRGKHTIAAVDGRGNRDEVEIYVK
ncbi:MAG: penicillin-binding protein 1C [Thermoanaerobaculia bacterium]|nr:penicillin-binding protein 1C [Thermoanaerobaculia bacterium]